MKIEIHNLTHARIPSSHIRKVLRWAWPQLRPFDLRKPKSPTARLTIAIVGVQLIRRLNRIYRKRDRVTDVLSFTSSEPGHLGELALCHHQLRIQAKEHGLNLRDEYVYLVIHGILHLLGHDHERGGQREKRMLSIQDQLFAAYMEKKWSR